MNNNITISLCMIVKNEEDTLDRCLDSVKQIADEIIIVDTGSTDKTKEIARKYKSKIFDFVWINDFSAARNFAFSKATKEYIFWLDADDYLTEVDIKKIVNLKKNFDKNIDSVTMNYSLSRDENGNTTYSLRRNRLVKKNKKFKWIGRIHEYLEVNGRIENLDISVHHGKIKPHGNRNLEIFREMQGKNQEFTSRDTYYFANELYYNGFYKEAIEQYESFINSKLGWVEDVKTATANLCECYNAVDDKEKKIKAILKTFEIDKPRADLCCKLGEYFIEKNLYRQAIFWYKIALGCTHDKDNLGMDMKDYYTWIPAIQLCVCYSALEEYEVAYYYNEMTALYVPISPKVDHNRKFLNGKLAELKKNIPEYKWDIVDMRYNHL